MDVLTIAELPFIGARDNFGSPAAPLRVELIERISAVNLTDSQLTSVFWSALTIEAILLAIIFLGSALLGWGSVGALLVVIPVVVLAITAGVFHVADARWVRIGCTLVLLSPVIAVVFGAPTNLVVHTIGDGIGMYRESQARSGADLFKESGQRKLAAAIVDRDIEKIKAALPGVGALNRVVNTNLPYYVPLGDTESLLSFACRKSDDSEASLEMIRLLLAAGANPNLPPGKPLASAIFRSTQLVEILLDAGADPNAESGSDEEPVWWAALSDGRDPDGKMLQMLLSHGANTARRASYGRGVIDEAVEAEHWLAVRLLVQHIPGGKDYVLDPALHVGLAQKLEASKNRGEPVPEDMSPFLARIYAEKD